MKSRVRNDASLYRTLATLLLTCCYATAQSPCVDQDDTPVVSSGGTSRTTIIAVVVPCTAVLAVIAAVLLYRGRRTRTVFGHVTAPTVTPTLLVTDIQNSTVLWEDVDPAVMDTAMHVHDATMRMLLSAHGGYESATEGDSFIVAFHAPEDAVAYAVAAQEALLVADWPERLLAHPDACAERARPTNRSKYALSRFCQGLVGADAHIIMSTRTSFSSFCECCASDVDAALHRNPRVSLDDTAVGTDVLGRLVDATFERCDDGVIVYRGLRVRMGVHCAGPSGETNTHIVAGRVQYSGALATFAKNVSDAGTGGTILMSESAFENTDMMRVDAHVLHIGEYVLNATVNAVLYQVLPRTLVARITTGVERVDAGIFGAHVGRAAVAFMTLVGAQILLEWNVELARKALTESSDIVVAALRAHGGYLARLTDGSVVASFADGARAAMWALRCHADMMAHAWDDVLLEHELCEEIAYGNATVMRGPRVKVGIDVGRVIDNVNITTGRIDYIGKSMNRAARLCSICSCGQTLISGTALRSARENGLDSDVTATDVGAKQLKGITERIEIYSLKRDVMRSLCASASNFTRRSVSACEYRRCD